MTNSSRHFIPQERKKIASLPHPSVYVRTESAELIDIGHKVDVRVQSLGQETDRAV